MGYILLYLNYVTIVIVAIYLRMETEVILLGAASPAWRQALFNPSYDR